MSTAIAIATELIKEFEGCELQAYPDPDTGGVPWTIGWGNTTYPDGRAVLPHDTITQTMADTFLAGTVIDVVKSCAATVPHWYKLNSNQQAALISFAYNFGWPFYRSGRCDTLDRALTQQDWQGVATALSLYTNHGLPGLVRRRLRESMLFLKPASEKQSTPIKTFLEPNLAQPSFTDLTPSMLTPPTFLRFVQASYLKAKPVQASTLSSTEKHLVQPGQTYRLHSHGPVSQGHYKVALADNNYHGKNTWYVYAPHVELKSEGKIIAPPANTIGKAVSKTLSKVLGYVPQPDGNTCQSAAIAKVTGTTNVWAVRQELLAIGAKYGEPAGSTRVMGEYLRPRVREYKFMDGSLNDMKTALDAGAVCIIHGHFTPAGHVINVDGWEEDSATKSYRFICDDPWYEFDFSTGKYTTRSGDNVRYSSYGIYAYCVGGASYGHAKQLYAQRQLNSSERNLWLHIIHN